MLAFGAQNAQALTEDFKLTASDPALGGRFGSAVAVDGDTMVVGAYGDDDNGLSSGSAYVFVRSGGAWTQEAKLKASGETGLAAFGGSVAISGDTAIIGAPLDDSGSGSFSGSAYIFTRSAGVWNQETKLIPDDTAANAIVGVSVAVDGDTAIVGAYGDDIYNGAAYVFVRIGGVWTQQAKLTLGSFEKGFGYSVSLSGGTAVVGAYQNDKSAYVFTRSGTLWTQQAILTANGVSTTDYFGRSVSVSGDTALVGAYGDDDAGSLSGSAYIFTRSGAIWTQQAKLTASDPAVGDNFDISVSVSGESAVIGAFVDDDASGSAYIFTRIGGVWIDQAKLTASDATAGDKFGYSVSVSGDMVVCGADEHMGGGAIKSGSAYVFDFFEPHSADQVTDHIISLSELLRVIQLYNLGSLHCDVLSEDGFNPGVVDTTCTPHTGDYNPQDWNIGFGELLRLIQLYNALRYYSCPGVGEDGFCPGTP